MTYLERKKVLGRCIHDVANLRAVKRNNGAMIRLDSIPREPCVLSSEMLRPCPRRSHSFPQVDMLEMVFND